MSTGADCTIREDDDGKWYYDLQRWPYGEWPEYDTFGPFNTYGEAQEHLSNHHANPGGFSIHRRSECSHPQEFRLRCWPGGWECRKCGYSERAA